MEQIPENDRILVLLPSLALLSQTLEEYILQTSWESLPAICVCSDPTVTEEADKLVMEQADFPHVVMIGGGMPIIADGEVVGGVGISGAASTATDVCVQAGIDAVAAQLR